MSSEDIIYTFEFIGSDLEVIEATDQGYEEIRGKIIDETRNMFVISDEGKNKMVPKNGNRFKLTINGHHNVLDGNSLKYRPEDRIKKLG